MPGRVLPAPGCGEPPRNRLTVDSRAVHAFGDRSSEKRALTLASICGPWPTAQWRGTMRHAGFQQSLSTMKTVTAAIVVRDRHFSWPAGRSTRSSRDSGSFRGANLKGTRRFGSVWCASFGRSLECQAPPAPCCVSRRTRATEALFVEPSRRAQHRPVGHRQPISLNAQSEVRSLVGRRRRPCLRESVGPHPPSPPGSSPWIPAQPVASPARLS